MAAPPSPETSTAATVPALIPEKEVERRWPYFADKELRRACQRGELAFYELGNARTIEPASPEDDLGYAYRPVGSVRHAFANTRARAGVPEMTRYSLRHLMASRASNHPTVPEKQIDIWMGHERPGSRSGRWYRHYEPDYPREAKQFTDAFTVELQEHCQRPLFAPENPADYRPLVYQKKKRKNP